MSKTVRKSIKVLARRSKLRGAPTGGELHGSMRPGDVWVALDEKEGTRAAEGGIGVIAWVVVWLCAVVCGKVQNQRSRDFPGPSERTL